MSEENQAVNVNPEPSIESEPIQENGAAATNSNAGQEFEDLRHEDSATSVSSETGLDPQGILSPETVSVKERFLYARRMQEMREKERLNRVKQDPKQTIKTARASFYEASPATKAFGDKFSAGVSTDSLWTETVQKMKQQQQERRNEMKKSTVDFSKQLQQNRVVTQRISQWEELFIQTETTAEELAQIWKIVKEYFHLFSGYGAQSPQHSPHGQGGISSISSSDNLTDLASSGGEKTTTGPSTINDSAAADAFRGKTGAVDDFTLGGTRVYSADTFGEKFVNFLTESFQALPPLTKYMGLVSGIFSEKSYKPPLRVITMGLKGDSGAYYVAITIKPLAGHEDDANLLGNRKIVVFKPNSAVADNTATTSKGGDKDNKNKRETHEKIFDITFQIVFTPSEREEGDVDVHDCNSLDAFTALVQSTNRRKSLGVNQEQDVPEELHSNVSIHHSPYVERAEEEKTVATATTENVLNESVDMIEPVDLMNTTVGDDDDDDDDEKGGNEEDDDDDDRIGPSRQSEVIADGIATTSVGLQQEEDEVAALAAMTADVGVNEKVKSQRLSMSLSPADMHGGGKGVLADVIDYEKKGILCQFSITPEIIDSMTSSSQYFIVKCDNRVIKNILISGNGRSSNVSSQSIAENDQVFEWIRGAAASGWISKFPTSKSYGRYNRRFFILQDNTLTYYKYKPSQEDFFNPHEYKADIQLHKDNDEDVEELSSAFAVGGYYVGGKAMIISDDTVIEKTSSMMNPILKIATPSTNQELALRITRGGEKETYWVQAIQKTIEIQKMKRTSVSPTIKTLWLHENPTYDLLCMDVKTSTENHSHHLKAALYFCELPAFCKRVQHHPNAAASRYILDLESDNKEKMQLELMKTNEKPFNEVKLQVIKIFGDLVVLGGSEGYIGIGTIGMTTDLTMGSNHQRVLYTIPCRADGPTRQRAGAKSCKDAAFLTGHGPSSTIKSLAVSVANHFFVAGDDARTITLWHFEQEPIAPDANTTTSMMLQSPQKKKAGFYYNIKPELHHVFELSDIDPERCFSQEKIVSLQFLRLADVHTGHRDGHHLLVSTTQRLLLLEIGVHYTFGEEKGEELKVPQHKVLGWVELDRVANPTKQFALFSLAIFDSSSSGSNNTGANSGAAGSLLQHHQGKVNISNSMIGKHSAPATSSSGSGVAPVGKRILYWKALKNENDTVWSVAKAELNEDKLLEAIRTIRPLKK